MALEYERLARTLAQDSLIAAEPGKERQPVQQQQARIAPGGEE